MKRVIFVEHPDDCSAAEEAFGGESEQPLLIDCNSGVELGALPPGWKIKSELDYYNQIDLKSLSHVPQKDLRQYFDAPEIAEFFSMPPYSLTGLFVYEFGRALATAYKFTDLLRVIFQRETCDEFVAIESPVRRATRLRFDADDKFLGLLAPAVMESLKDSQPTLRLSILKTSPKTVQISKKNKGERFRPFLSQVLRSSFQIFQRIINFSFQITSRKRARIFFKGAPRLMFELMKKLKQDGKYSPVYYQPEFAPRLFFKLLAGGFEYKNLSRMETQDNIWMRKKNEFYAALERRGFFYYRGVNLLPVLRGKFDFLFETLLPKMAAELRTAERFLRHEKPAALIVDEENSVSSQCLLLASEKLSIPTFEYQHGAIYHYDLQNGLAKRYLLWGEFFKEKMNRELHMPRERMSVVGPLHLASLVSAVPEEETARKRGRLLKKISASAASGFILYATHSFNKGSRGGLHRVHMTYREVTALLTCLLESVSQTPEKHLVIKLHHEDKNVSFYRNFIESFGKGIRYSVIQNLPIHELIRCCDFIIAPPSTTVLEAILLGKPVLLTDFEEKRAVFPFAEWGAVSYARNPDEFARLYQELINSPQEIVAGQTAGRERILRDFADMQNALSGNAFLTAIGECV